MIENQDFRVSIAPMMDWTDRHCRWFHRQLSRHVWLYTEMVVGDAAIHGNRDYLLGFDAAEHPVVLQLGGSDPHKLADAAKIGADYGYDEINLNIGCPSDRVQSGQFGACLMTKPKLVAECYSAMQRAVKIPITIKCRIGVDDQEVTQTLPDFIKILSDAGCGRFIIHARKAWLDGLSPKDNRTVPPLDYALVRQMKDRFADVKIELNGGLDNLDMAQAASQGLDGFMLGRAAYHNPWLLTKVDSEVFGEPPFVKSRSDVFDELIAYAKDAESQAIPVKSLLRHVMGLYTGQPGARMWRRSLSELAAKGLKASDALEHARAERQAYMSERAEA